LVQVAVKRDLTIFRGALYRDAQPFQSGAIFADTARYIALYHSISRSIAMHIHFNQARYLAP
jgi:hypothetical protein